MQINMSMEVLRRFISHFNSTRHEDFLMKELDRMNAYV